MSNLKIVHYSPTPLVAAPSKISKLLEEFGHDSIWIISSDYPNNGPLFKKFSDNAFILNSIDKLVLESIEKKISYADIIHIHNDISSDLATWFYLLNPSAKYIYQSHSPIQEGPLYIDRSKYINLPFSHKLVVAQYQPRHYQNFTLIPNIILDNPSIKLRADDEKLKILFSPTHSRSGKWNKKYSEVLLTTLTSLKNLDLIDLISLENPVSPSNLMLLRKSCHVTIDEIVTGAYHQVSLEGLCAGNIVLNRSDFFSNEMLRNIAKSDNQPPFIHTNEYNVQAIISKLAFNPKLCREIQLKSFNYFKNHLNKTSMIKHFLEVYHG